mgnify:CR=1 FL=1
MIGQMQDILATLAQWRQLPCDEVPLKSLDAVLAEIKPPNVKTVKMDIEGAEKEIVPALLRSNTSRLVDVFLWECHAKWKGTKGKCQCAQWEEALRRASAVGESCQVPSDMSTVRDFSPASTTYSPALMTATAKATSPTPAPELEPEPEPEPVPELATTPATA